MANEGFTTFDYLCTRHQRAIGFHAPQTTRAHRPFMLSSRDAKLQALWLQPENEQEIADDAPATLRSSQLEALAL